MIELIQRHIIPATFELMPDLASDNAAIMLLAIGLQESRFQHRRQVKGPARGYWQFERVGVMGTFAHSASSARAIKLAGALGYRFSGLGLGDMTTIVHEAIEHNDVLACGIARLYLFTHPVALPLPGERESAWQQYKAIWNPGRPKVETWEALYSEAVERVRLSHSDTRLA